MITVVHDRKLPDYIQIAIAGEARSRLPLEWWKTGVALVYALFSLVLTAVMITVVHERVPPKELSPPLPDKFFDYIDRVKWAFFVSEVNGIVLLGLWVTQWLFLRYKSIVGRRFFFLLGTLYLYRCITMYVTTLPVPGMHIQCAPKLNGDSQAKVQRILRLISGGGLSITGSHALCGDFLFSGHTVTMTLLYLFIKECEWGCCDRAARPHPCSPPWWPSPCCLAHPLLGKQHPRNLKVSSQTNFLSRAWWFPVFHFFEKNIQGSVPCAFSWPLSWPPGCFKSSCKKYSRVQKSGEDSEKST
ncbi:phosphatidylcholine:ceramide cholinephosphotransferase 2 [Fukomys damarensis]|uniref:phosphatidylcholine:ceramide cholinephosphotransferase 2 n=1 Tax=Fukomys damarensis TaxID=885580 RepID=UPI00053FC5B5|nr:phosphatidylcholine:ceramide cholinephosphotransferase 2 [Fukomys damarensis]